MALIIDYDGFGVVADANAISDPKGGTWAELGGGSISANPDTIIYEGGATPATIGSKYASKSGFTYVTTNTALNFTTTENGQFLYFWVFVQSTKAFDTLVNDGFFLYAGSDTNNYYKFRIAGSDDANGWSLGKKLFVCDITLGEVVGNPDDTAINSFGAWIDTIISVRAESIFLSQIMCAKGLKVEGTSATMYDDIVFWCEDYINRAAGMFQKRGQTYFSLGGLTIHSDTANTLVSSNSNNVEYEKSEFYNGTAWVTSYPTDANLITVTNTGGNTTSMTDTNIGLSGNDINKLSIDTSLANNFSKIGGSLKYISTLSSTANDTYNGVVISLYDARTLGAEPYIACIFDGSNTLTIGAIADFANGNTINGKTGIDSVSVTTLEYLSTTKFISSGSNHATNLTTVGDGSMDWNCITSGFDVGETGSPVIPTATGNEDIYISATTGTVNISVASGATTPSIRSAGAVVNVIAGLLPLTITVKSKSTGLGIPDANVSVQREDTKATIIIGTTNAVGVYSESVAASYDGVAYIVWARQSDLTDPDYVSQDQTGTISSTGADINFSLEIQD